MPFEELKQHILSRRTTKPECMNGNIIPKEDIMDILKLANWAPTHGHTEPWRFVVFSGDGLDKFSRFHAELYKRTMEAKGQNPVKYTKILRRAKNTSHIIAIGMKRGDHPKIPANEEHASTAIAAHNIWLGANAKGIACYWGSGGMTYHPEMKAFLGLDSEQDEVLGFLFLGYTDREKSKGKRLTGIESKINWVNKP